MNRRVITIVTVALVPATALADDDAAVAPKPSMTLAQGAAFAQVNLEIGLNNGAAWKPVSIAPDLSYGVTSELTLALVHSTFALTGFRGASGAGLCLTGTTGACPNVYQDVGAEALYSLTTGSLAIAAEAGILALDLQPASTASFDFALKLGVKAKYTAGRFYAVFLPSVWLGLTDRTIDVAGVSTPLNGDRLYLPISAWWKVVPELALGGVTGINGPLSGFGNAYKVALGVLAQLAITKQIAVGGSLVFGKVLGGAPAGAPNNAGFDARSCHLWFNYSL